MSDQSARSPNRREVLQVALGLITVGGLALTNRVRRRLIRHQVPALGTLAELAVVHHNEKYARAALGAAASELKRVEALMTRFERTSDIGRANLHAGVARVRVSAETAQIVLRALEWAQASDGAFDPAIARVVDLWDVKTRRSLPAHDAVERLANRNLYRRIDVDADARSASVFVREPDAALDLGGIAAGYGVDRAVAVLRDWGIRDGFVNVSGDIYALGHSADAEPWDVGIRSPSDPAQLRGRVALSDAAVATSGDYEQGFTLGPRRYHHIMDPHTAEPRISALHSVTITAPSCLEADAASTAVFGWQPAVAQLLLDRCSPGARLVGSA